MVGDDANVVFTELLKQLLEIIRNMSNERNKNPKVKKEKKPKIKFGKLSKCDFEKLKKAGNKFCYISVPRDKLEELEKTAKDVGGSFFAAKINDGNNAVIAVPESQINEINAALKHIAAEQMKNAPDSLVVKDGSEKISEEDIKIVSDVLRSHDIPVYTFKSSDGKYMNVVPKEFDGQYEKAIAESKEIKKQLDNIEVTRYEQTAPLDSLDFAAEKMTEEEARELSAAIRAEGLDVKFCKTEDGITAFYPKDISDKIQKARDEYKSSLDESEKFLVEVTNDTATMNMEKLLVEEDNNSYFVRVPNTGAQDYLRINKSDADVINGGKTLSMKIDMENQYQIFDADKNLKSERSGAELSKCYNTKYKHVDKNTKIYHSGDNFRRIDLYNKEQNRLVSVGITNASNVRAELLGQGISPKAADKLLSDINDKLPENYKQIFNYSAEKSEVVYADIPNIGEYLAQSQLSETVIGKAECFGEFPKDSGGKCCIFDKNENQYTILPILPKSEIAAKLTEMGYSELTAQEISEKVLQSYNKNDIEKLAEKVSEKTETITKQFESANPELKNFMYHVTEDSAVIVQENAEDFKYMEIDSGMSRTDIEAALISGFDIKDEISAAEIMKSLTTEKIIPDPVQTKVGDITVSAVSSNFIEISKDGNFAIMPKNKLDSEKLAGMGISEREKDIIAKSFEKSEKTVSNPIKQKLHDLKKYAAEMRGKINEKKDNQEKTKSESSKEQSKPSNNQER